MHLIVEELSAMIAKNEGWSARFDEAIESAAACEVDSISDIRSVSDFLQLADDLVHWTPRESRTHPRMVYERLVEFYFFLDQPSVKELQTHIDPDVDPKTLTPLSEWIVRFAVSWGDYLDTTESAAQVESFKEDPMFNWDEYMPPPSGYLTFNQFFARHVKPGMRPVAGLRQDEIIVSPADCTFVGSWRISESGDITVYGEKDGLVESKGLQWSIGELLSDSEYADRFRGGIFTHSFLNTIDYHRWHTPVQGKILEQKIIHAQAYLDVNVTTVLEDGKPIKKLNALDGTGYQFRQTRGLIVIDSPIGLVACLPMGMAHVSSVVITAEKGVTVRKGEELGYFQFGGSDFVIVFERSSNVQLIGQPNVHVQQGEWIGTAFPYSMRSV